MRPLGSSDGAVSGQEVRSCCILEIVILPVQLNLKWKGVVAFLVFEHVGKRCLMSF